MKSERVPVGFDKHGRKWRFRYDVQRQSVTCHETEEERLKAAAQRGKTGRPKVGDARLSDLAEAILKSGD